MKRGANQIIAFLLLLCIAASALALSIPHHHEEKPHCDSTNSARESDPCHLKIYHSETEGEHCGHAAHLDETHEKCLTCALVIAKRDGWCNFFSVSFAPYGTIALFFPNEEPDPSGYFSNVIFDRGPPVLTFHP